MLNTDFCSNRRTYFQKLDQHRKTNSSNIRINQVTLSHPIIYKLNTADITSA